ncbi:type 1 glutamine amidotransferase [Synechococcus sp. RSCCF101]|uniref:type 1 glutamine amidotransferase n=1 Tax=Synechococcus sp. RSCCF101 TaxID=2511069 RepID=UPI00124481B8|nr:type 1 glutamine amidotransferase [Synechococcus sp. RSCCF101]QEY31279.1 type 1 glutamine amidotransferase [Synechococcus sp. RSCCF101]
MARLWVLQHLAREGPGLFASMAKAHRLEVEVRRLDRGDPLPEPGGGDGLLVLGGPMGVGDLENPAYPWLKAESDLIRHSLEKGTPVIGVCLGAQLLAHAAGGNVEPLLGGRPPRPQPEVGWGAIELMAEERTDPMLAGLPKRLDVLHWHGDRILLPASARLLARSERCLEQLFRIGETACGLQFHVEVEREGVEQWIEEDGAFIRSALGDGAAMLLRSQQERHGAATGGARRQLLENLFNVLW